MAKLLMGSIVTAAVGRLNGHCFRLFGNTQVLQRNPLPARVSVISKNSAIPLAQRSFSSWSNLTLERRTQWNEVALANPVIDRFGNPKTLSGRAYYCKIAINLGMVNEAVIRPDEFNSTVPTCAFANIVINEEDETFTYLEDDFAIDSFLVVNIVKVRGSFNHPNPNKIKFCASFDTNDYDFGDIYKALLDLGFEFKKDDWYAVSTCVVSASGVVSPKVLTLTEVIFS